jgi:hypothetical protein
MAATKPAPAASGQRDMAVDPDPVAYPSTRDVAFAGEPI